jgi:signal peptidase II
MKPLNLGLALAALTIVVDQATKWLILEVAMQPPRVIEVLPVFNLVLTWNRGVSFGMFNDVGNGLILSLVALAVVVVLTLWLRRSEALLTTVGLGLIIGGALGNVLDRAFRDAHAVVDFLDVHWGGYHWPAFNVADSCITVGAILLVADSLFSGRTRTAKISESK